MFNLPQVSAEDGSEPKVSPLLGPEMNHVNDDNPKADIVLELNKGGCVILRIRCGTTHFACSPSSLQVDLPASLQPLPPLQEVPKAAGGGVVGVGGRGIQCGLGRPTPLAVRPSVAVVEGLRAAALE